MANEIQVSDMTKYLGDIYQMEKELYKTDKLCLNAEQLLKHYKNPELKKYEEIYISRSTSDIIIGSLISGILIGALGAVCGAIGGLLWALFYNMVEFSSFGRSRIGLLSSICRGALILFAVCFIISFIRNFADEFRLERFTKKHNADANKQNVKIRFENENILSIANKKADLAKEDLTKIQNAREMLSNTLNLYYSMDIIFPKYRNLVAISTLYEYFVTGRCCTLGISDSGHEGAYNIYERELRENRIIAQLDQAIKLLDQIIENQQMLYSAINECNETCKRIKSSMESSFEKLQNSTKVIAYNSKITRQNTEYLSWLETAKWIWVTR